MEYVDVGPERGQLPNAFRRGRYILEREARIKMYRMPEDALGSCPRSGPDIRIYLRIYKFVNFFQKSACTVLES